MKEKFIAFIPVRGGSKGIPNKNIKNFCGQPLVYWVIKAVNDSKNIDKVYVATDSGKIKLIVESFNLSKVQVVERSKDVSTDIASTESVMLEFAKEYDFKNIVLVQATSPLLESKDLDKAILKFEKEKCDSMLSLVRQKRFLWELDKGFVKPINYDYLQRPRRQDFEGFFVENGAFYITSKERLLQYKCRLSGKIRFYEMDEDSYHEIDDLNDWKILENLKFERLQNNVKNFYNLRNINLLISDVDGVLTDGGMYYSESGEKLKKFNTKDGKGIELVKKLGIKVMFLSGEKSEYVRKRAEKLKVDFLCLGVQNKLEFLNHFFKENKAYAWRESAYIGDDLNDLECLQKVYFSVCPSDGVFGVKNVVKYLCVNSGGDGAVREICNLILSYKNE